MQPQQPCTPQTAAAEIEGGAEKTNHGRGDDEVRNCSVGEWEEEEGGQGGQLEEQNGLYEYGRVVVVVVVVVEEDDGEGTGCDCE